MTKALEEQRQSAAILPKRVTYRFNVSLYASYSGDFQAGEREARALLELDPTYAGGFTALAWAQLGQGQLAQAAESYKTLEKFGKAGASDAVSGLADLAVYEGRFKDAVQILEKGAADELAAKYPDNAATRYATLAYARLQQGQTLQAVAAAQNALSHSKTVKIRFLAGRVFAAAGQSARAQALAAGLGSELQPEPKAYAKLIEGQIALRSGDPKKAITAFSEANALADTWIGRFDLGRAYLEAEAFPEADSEFDRCIKRRGEALSLFNEEPTYGFFPPVYYYLGRVREGMKSKGFAESYRTYLSIREKAAEDPVIPEVRKRAGSS
jgi:tetratricopeptide (TPR) repeat protein